MVLRDKGPTNPIVASLIIELRALSNKHNVKIWRAVSEKLKKPRRNRPEVNVSKINRYTNKNEVVLVPGKVIGAGKIDHPVTVAAISFSEGARNKIETAKGRTLTIRQLVDENPKGSGVRIIA